MKKATHIESEYVEKLLTENSPTQGKRVLEPLASLAAESNLPINVVEDTDVINNAEVHMNTGDLWLCLEGEVTFTCGGELVEPWSLKNEDGTENKSELQAEKISGGEDYTVKKGDWLWIPPSVPHTHSSKGTARLMIAKIPKA
jgi:mannose-6-phosphate isomerase-like protein (cupin superfamily)